MHVRLPKPLHGWRAFCGEVGVIVLGVIIALGASQLVEAWQWKNQIKQANEAFEYELWLGVMNAYVRLATEPCLERRLIEIEAKVNEPGEKWHAMAETLKFPEPDPIPAPYHGYLPAPPISTNAWNNALSNGIVAHLPSTKASDFSEAYDALSRFREDRRQEQMTIPELMPLATERTLTSDNRIAMLQSIGKLQHLDDMIKDDSEAIVFAAQKAAPVFTDAAIQSDGAREIAMARRVRGQCVTLPNSSLWH